MLNNSVIFLFLLPADIFQRDFPLTILSRKKRKEGGIKKRKM